MVTRVKMNADQSNEGKQRRLIQSLLYSKGVSHHHSHCQTQRQVEEWKSFRVEGEEDFRDALIEGWLLA